MDAGPRHTHRRELCDNPYFRVIEDTLVIADGRELPYYSLQSHWNAVVVVPVLDDGRLVLERIYRHPYGRHLWEFPAGGIEPDEDPCAAAVRELAEETGYRAGTTHRLGAVEVMPGLLVMRLHFILATDLVLAENVDHEPLEFIEVATRTRDEAWALAREDGASTFLVDGLLWLEHDGNNR